MNDQVTNMLQDLSPEQYQAAIKILQEYQSTGKSDTLAEINQADYDEIPVDIYTFLTDSNYLGKGLINDAGQFTVFPYWVDLLKEIFPDPMKPAIYNTLALTGAIGLGKSFVAVLVGLYELYRMLCLKDPYLYYGMQPIDRITFAVMNITLDAAKSVAWDKMQQLLQISPWFSNHGTVTGTTNITWQPNKNIELIAGSLPRHIIGRAVYWAFFDEVSFQINSDVEKQKKKAKELVSTAAARMQSRFMKNDINPTILVLASSKRTEQSYMETFIQEKKKNESKTTKIIDEPQWVIRPDKDSAIKFKVAIGNKFLSSEVVPLDATEQDLDIYRARGYTLLDVPIGYYETFVDDIDIALTDVAGISTTSSTRYFAGPRIVAATKPQLQNLFVRDVIEVGNAPEDKAQYWDFIDLSRLDKNMKSRPLYIHLDMSLSGDKTGIGGVWIKGKKPSTSDDLPSKDLYYQAAFSISVKAPKGYQVSFEKNRNFIRWLRKQGFNVKGVSSDTYQSADLQQQLTAEHFNCSVISVDRVDQKSRVCQPYLTLKNAIYEERLDLYNSKLLIDELLGLEKDGSGHIDHSSAGINSKDAADGICGAVYNASQHAEEFAYEYGETLDITLSVNEETRYGEYGQALLDSLLPSTRRIDDDGIISFAEVQETYDEPEMPLAQALAETINEYKEEKQISDEEKRKQEQEEIARRVAEAKRLQQSGPQINPNDYNMYNRYDDGILIF